MRNLEWCIYTYRHRRAFEYCVRRYITEPSLRAEMLKRAAVHDMDKMLMYLFMDQRAAQEMHTRTQPHHLENYLPRTYEDYVETVIDYECAPYTKPDKPLNAYDFTHRLMEWKVLDTGTGNRLLSIIKELVIDNSETCIKDADGQEYISSFSVVTEEMIQEELLTYIRNNPESALGVIIQCGETA